MIIIEMRNVCLILPLNEPMLTNGIRKGDFPF